MFGQELTEQQRQSSLAQSILVLAAGGGSVVVDRVQARNTVNHLFPTPTPPATNPGIRMPWMVTKAFDFIKKLINIQIPTPRRVQDSMGNNYIVWMKSGSGGGGNTVKRTEPNKQDTLRPEEKKVTDNIKQIISEKDRAKISRWDYPPSDELYLKYKHVFDNSKYYNQETGAINWPENDGFLNTPIEETLQPGFRLDRYGYDSGTFVSPEGIPYEMRAVAPGTDLRPYNVFEVVSPIKVKGGEIAPWFDEIGGGRQYVLTDSVENLIDEGILRRVTQ